MTLRWFGGIESNNLVYNPNTGQPVPGDRGTVWADPARTTQITDLLDANMSPITDGVITTDTYGYMQRFATDEDPAVDKVWVDFTAGLGPLVGVVSESAGGLSDSDVGDLIATPGTDTEAALSANYVPRPAAPTEGQLLRWDATLGEWVAQNPVGNSRNASAKNTTGTVTTFNPGASGGSGAVTPIPSTAISVTNSGGRTVTVEFDITFNQTVTGTGCLFLYLRETTSGTVNLATFPIRLPGTATVGSYDTRHGEFDIGVVTTTRTFDLSGSLYTPSAVVPVLQALNGVAFPTWLRAENA